MAYRIAALLLLVILLGSVTIDTTEAVDCRRFVFAPACRGISAKRAQMPPLQFRDLKRAKGFASPSKLKQTTADEDQADYDTVEMHDDYLRTLLRKYLNRLEGRVGASADQSAAA